MMRAMSSIFVMSRRVCPLTVVESAEGMFAVATASVKDSGATGGLNVPVCPQRTAPGVAVVGQGGVGENGVCAAGGVLDGVDALNVHGIVPPAWVVKMKQMRMSE